VFRFIRAHYINPGTGEIRQKDWVHGCNGSLPDNVKDIVGWHNRRAKQWGEGLVVDLYVALSQDDNFHAVAGKETVGLLDFYFPAKDHGFAVESRCSEGLRRRFASVKEAGKFISELCQKSAA